MQQFSMWCFNNICGLFVNFFFNYQQKIDVTHMLIKTFSSISISSPSPLFFFLSFLTPMANLPTIVIFFSRFFPCSFLFLLFFLIPSPPASPNDDDNDDNNNNLIYFTTWMLSLSQSSRDTIGSSLLVSTFHWTQPNWNERRHGNRRDP